MLVPRVGKPLGVGGLQDPPRHQYGTNTTREVVTHADRRAGAHLSYPNLLTEPADPGVGRSRVV